MFACKQAQMCAFKQRLQKPRLNCTLFCAQVSKRMRAVCWVTIVSLALLACAEAQTSIVSEQYSLFAPYIPTITTIAYSNQLKPICGSNAVRRRALLTAREMTPDFISLKVHTL